MRTTINLDDDVLRAARSLANERGESIGTVVSELARKALTPVLDARYEGSFPVFMVREGAPAISPEMVREAFEDQ